MSIETPEEAGAGRDATKSSNVVTWMKPNVPEEFESAYMTAWQRSWGMIHEAARRCVDNM